MKLSYPMKQRALLLLLLTIAVAVKYAAWSGVPYVANALLPIQYVSSFFHEVGHGLGALVTGEKFYRIILTFGASGMAAVEDTGDNAFHVFTGYMMPSLVGMVLLCSLARDGEETIRIIPFVLVGIMLGSGLLWVRDFITLIILLVMWGTFRALTFMEKTGEVALFLKFLGVYLIISGAADPLGYYYWSGGGEGTIAGKKILWDGAKLMQLTGKNEIYWIWVWGGTALLAMMIACFVQEVEHRDIHTQKLRRQKQAEEEAQAIARAEEAK